MTVGGHLSPFVAPGRRQRAHAVPEFAEPRRENRRPVRHAGDLLHGMFDVGVSG